MGKLAPLEKSALPNLPFTRKNWSLFVISLATIILGYVLLSIPPADGFLSLTLAPIVLVVGYCVLIPWAILLKDNPAPPFTTREAQSGPSRNPNPRA